MTAETTIRYPVAIRPDALPRIAAIDGVGEDREYYIPDFIGAELDGPRSQNWQAANDHARHLRDAGQQLDDVQNLAGVLRRANQDAGDSRAMQTDTVLRIIDCKLQRARRLIDRHDARHLNLFMAYFDPERGPAGHGDV